MAPTVTPRRRMPEIAAVALRSADIGTTKCLSAETI
jgi:hypothetical protein